MNDQIVIDHPRIVRICGRLSTTADGNPISRGAVSRFADAMPFNDRLREAARHAGVDWSQTAVAKSLGYSKQTVDRWFGPGEPKPAQVFAIAEKWKVSPKWLATGDGQMVTANGDDAVAKDAREEMMLLLFRGLTPEQQRELVLEINALVSGNREVQKRFLNKPLRTFGNQDVAAAFGQVPTPAQSKRSKNLQRGKKFHEDDPE